MTLSVHRTLLSEPRPLLLSGQPTECADSTPVVFPYDGSEVARVASADAAIVERALEQAVAAEEEVAAVPPHRRAEILQTAARLVRERRDDLAQQMTLETGLPIGESQRDVQRTAEVFQIAGEEARNISASGELVAIDAVERGQGRYGLTRRFPVGTVLGITAFNAPLLLVAHKLAPAFAAGNPCIIRPAPRTPLSALALGEVLVDAGAPPAAVSVVPSSNELAERMVRDERVKMISFTGSARVGWHLKDVAATPRVTLELGGNGAVVVHRDADVAYAAERCGVGGFLRSGQVCISVQRLYVHTEVAAELTERMLAGIAQLRTGNPLDEATTLGGVIDEAAAAKSMAQIETARAAGAELLCGGGRDGTVIEPTVLINVPEASELCAEEAFAPVIALAHYDDIDEVLERVDNSPYGLQAGLFTSDLRVMNRAFERLHVGALIVNDVNAFRVDQMPYGGAKRSGWGREGLRAALKDMTEERLLVVDPR